MATRRLTFQLFPRNRYIGGATAKVYFPRDRVKLHKTLGGATRVSYHVRVYDRSSTSAILDFEVSQGSIGDEAPSEGVRVLTLTNLGQSPTMPWNNTNMTSIPDDGTFYVSPTLASLDTAAKVSGGASEWVEFECWATADFT